MTVAGQFDSNNKHVKTEIYDLTLNQWSIGGDFPENSWSHSIGQGLERNIMANMTIFITLQKYIWVIFTLLVVTAMVPEPQVWAMMDML